MNNGNLNNNEIETIREHLSGKEFVEAVAAAGSKEELSAILRANGIDSFSGELLDECWPFLALSRDRDALYGIFQDSDYESCAARLAAHGVETTRENFDVITDMLKLGSDEALCRAIMAEPDAGKQAALAREHGCETITQDFLTALNENVSGILDDGLLTLEELKGLAARTRHERFMKAVNLMFAVNTISCLALGLSGAMAPSYMIAIALGLSVFQPDMMKAE